MGLRRGDSGLAAVGREALVKSEPPVALSGSPPGTGSRAGPAARLSDPVIEMPALKLAEDDPWLVIRLFEPTGRERRTRVEIPALRVAFDAVLGPFELKTFAVDTQSREVFETDLLERRL